MIRAEYPIQQGDYTRAGEASADMKRILKQLGIDGSVLRRISVAAYEAELNIVIHSWGGKLSFAVGEDGVCLCSEDTVPGIPDIAKAMSEGYSTADELARGLGFGAGMGLPNMKRNADVFEIESKEGEGTRIDMLFRRRARAYY